MADDKLTCNDLLRDTRRYIEELVSENERLRGAAAEAAGDRRRLEERFAEVERQNSNLAALYAASYQLHATVRRAEVLLAIQEIVVNLIGSEELAILGVGPGRELVALASVGVSPAQLAALRADAGLVACALASQQPEVGPPSEMTACIPLAVDARPVGAIAIFRLLRHKPALDLLDLELFKLLASHAANALYCAELHERGERTGAGDDRC